MDNNSYRHILIPENLEGDPIFHLNALESQQLQITYYKSIFDIYTVYKHEVELILIEDKIYEEWTAAVPEVASLGVILLETGELNTIPDFNKEILGWITREGLNNLRWNFIVQQALTRLENRIERAKMQDQITRQNLSFRELHDIGVSLSSEKDINVLLDLIVSKAMRLTHADGGTLYLVEPIPDTQEVSGDYLANKQLRLQVAMNDSRDIQLGSTLVLKLTSESIYGNVILNGESILIEDIYELHPESEYNWGGKIIDDKFNYRTKSMLTVPMRNNKKEVIGAVQLLNCKSSPDKILGDPDSILEEVVPFTERDAKFAESVASQAAVALDNAQLIDSIQVLFDGFINASVKAIESRDPTTSGHSSRVATLTIALAETVHQISNGTYASTRFTSDQLSEVRYASLLHDFGKIGVEERVLIKSKKLYPEEQLAVMDRFRLIKSMLELETSRKQLNYFLDESRETALVKYESEGLILHDQLEELDEYLKFIIRANEPTVLAQGGFDKLNDLANLTFPHPAGIPMCYLNEEELSSLSVPKGSLNEQDRKEIESHVTHTYNFLNIIPWSVNLERVPDIAHAHHEKLNGSGYPLKLKSDEIPLESKMMTIADIYDALTAWDRPYKKAMPAERALNILGFEAKDSHIDQELLDIFINAKLYRLVERPRLP